MAAEQDETEGRRRSVMPASRQRSASSALFALVLTLVRRRMQPTRGPDARDAP
jgi:hypothetical protein